MTKYEFEKFAKKPITESQYRKLETVYTFHPSISETEGKKQIAFLYDNFGMRIIEDLLPTANKAMVMQSEIERLQMRLSKLKSEYSDFCSGIKGGNEND